MKQNVLYYENKTRKKNKAYLQLVHGNFEQ